MGLQDSEDRPWVSNTSRLRGDGHWIWGLEPDAVSHLSDQMSYSPSIILSKMY